MRRNYVGRSLCLLALFLMIFYLGNYRQTISFGREVIAYPKDGLINQLTVVIDAGHGGGDPGKVGVHGEEEKKINLQIAQKVKRNLEHQGIHAVMTREDDNGLYSAQAANKKREDMNKRINIINGSNAVLAVSIHQNSFTDSQYKGAQVFYYETSENAKAMAELIQKSLIQNADSENTRQAKANDSYYLLKKSEIPMVIIECGFLSNENEALKLSQDSYQEKLAWAVHLGIMQYIHEYVSLTPENKTAEKSAGRIEKAAVYFSENK